MNYKEIIKVAVFCLASFFSNQLFSAVKLIVENGQSAAGFPSGYTYWSVGNPALGPSGHVIFSGVAISDDNVNQVGTVWSGLPGQFQVVLKENESPIGFPSNVLYDRMTTQPVVTSSGNAGFMAWLKGPTSSFVNQGVIAILNGKTHGVLRNGEQAPGFPPGFVINLISSFVLTDAGMALQAMVRDPNNANRLINGYWFWNFDTLEIIQPPIEDCDYISISSPISINASGEVAFGSGIGGDLCPIETFGIFKWKSGTTRMVLSDGDTVPNMINTEFKLLSSAVSLPTLNNFIINDHGEVLFFATLRDTINRAQQESIWVIDSEDSPRLLTLAGEFLSGNETGGFIVSSLFSHPVLSNGLSLVLQTKQDISQAILIGNPKLSQPYANINDAGLSQLSSIAQLNNESPAGFDETWFFSTFVNIFLNNNEQYAFSGMVADARDTSNSQTAGIWRGTFQSDLELVAYAGMPVSIRNEKMTLNQLVVETMSGSTVGGHTTQFDDKGQMVFAGIASSDTRAQASGIFLLTDQNETQEEMIFSLAEQKLARFFAPANAANQTAAGFLFRFYSTTNTYLGFKDGEVYLFGQPFGPSILNVGTVPNILEFLENN